MLKASQITDKELKDNPQAAINAVHMFTSTQNDKPKFITGIGDDGMILVNISFFSIYVLVLKQLNRGSVTETHLKDYIS